MKVRTAKTQRARREEGREEVAYLRSAGAIRDRCGELFKLGCEGRLSHFGCDLTRLERVADYVIEVMREEYSDLEIPFHSRWRHFEAGGVPRLIELDQMLVGLTPLEKAKAKFDLVIVSVLLDAGAGNRWQYYEQESDRVFGRSEGLAVASFRMFCQGAFSSDRQQPLQADALGLQGLSEEVLADGFGVSSDNPLVGLVGRVELLQRLGKVLLATPEMFGENPRPGNLVNYLLEQSRNGQLADQKVLSAVLEGLGDIWLGRIEIAGVNLGDVWYHPALLKVKKTTNYQLPTTVRAGLSDILVNKRKVGVFLERGFPPLFPQLFKRTDNSFKPAPTNYQPLHPTPLGKQATPFILH